jgi:hypothetical protein
MKSEGWGDYLNGTRQFVARGVDLCSLSTVRVRNSTVVVRIGPSSDAAGASEAADDAARAGNCPALSRGTSTAMRHRMRRALMNLLPSLVTFAPSLFVLAMTILAIANNLPGLARVRIPHAG